MKKLFKITLVVIIALLIINIFIGCGTGKSDKAKNTEIEGLDNKKNIENDYIKKINNYKSELAKNPSDITVREKLASYGYFELGMFYLRIYETDNNAENQKTYYNKAQEQLNLAIVEFEKVVQEKPNDAPALVDLASSYYFTGNIDKAIATDKKSIAAAPDLSPPKINYASHLAAKGDKVEAINVLNEIPPSDREGYAKAQELISKLLK